MRNHQDTPLEDDDPTRTWRRPDCRTMLVDAVSARRLLDEGFTDEAVAMYLQVLERDERDLDALKGLGLAWIRLGRCCNAAHTLRTALAIDPTDPMIHYSLAISSFGTGQYAEAENAIRALERSAPRLAISLRKLARS